MATIRLATDFKEFLRLLNAHAVEYLLIGGYAVIYHGHPRATGDLDVWVAVHPDNAARVVDVLTEFGFATNGLSVDLLTEPNRVIRMGVPPLRIEIQTSISGVSFSDCYARGLVVEIDGLPVRVISLADLRTNKRAAGRNKDLNDLENLP